MGTSKNDHRLLCKNAASALFNLQTFRKGTLNTNLQIPKGCSVHHTESASLGSILYFNDVSLRNTKCDARMPCLCLLLQKCSSTNGDRPNAMMCKCGEQVCGQTDYNDALTTGLFCQQGRCYQSKAAAAGGAGGGETNPTPSATMHRPLPENFEISFIIIVSVLVVLLLAVVLQVIKKRKRKRQRAQVQERIQQQSMVASMADQRQHTQQQGGTQYENAIMQQQQQQQQGVVLGITHPGQSSVPVVQPYQPFQGIQMVQPSRPMQQPVPIVVQAVSAGGRMGCHPIAMAVPVASM